MRVRCALLFGFSSLMAVAALAGGLWPLPVSPGDPAGLALIGDACPTFSWGTVAGARGYELVVYRLGENEELTPVLREALAGSASSWTPALHRCLERGRRYAWSVRAVRGREASEWSAPSLFQVAAGPTEGELEEALRVVRRHWVALSGERVDLAEVGEESQILQGQAALAPTPGAPATTQLSVDGGVEATSFAGDGSGLTAVDAASLDGTSLDDLTTDAELAGEMAGHSGDASAHHVPPTELPPTGPAGGDLAGTYPNPGVVAAIARDSEVTAQITAHANVANAHHSPVTLEDITPTTAKGDLLVEAGADVVALPVGTDGQLLVADSAATEGLAWDNPPGSVYTRWGHNVCPAGDSLIYAGTIWGGHHNHHNGGEPLCVKPNDPGPMGTSSGDTLYPLSVDHNNGTDVERKQILHCAVCEAATSPCYVAAGTDACEPGYVRKYRGYFFGGHYIFTADSRICIEGGTGGSGLADSGDYLYVTTIHDIQMEGQGYTSGRALRCAVCCA